MKDSPALEALAMMIRLNGPLSCTMLCYQLPAAKRDKMRPICIGTIAISAIDGEIRVAHRIHAATAVPRNEAQATVIEQARFMRGVAIIDLRYANVTERLAKKILNSLESGDRDIRPKESDYTEDGCEPL